MKSLSHLEKLHANLDDDVLLDRISLILIIFGSPLVTGSAHHYYFRAIARYALYRNRCARGLLLLHRQGLKARLVARSN